MIETLLRKHFDKMNTKTNWDKEWPFGPAVVNAAYMPSQNSISKLHLRMNRTWLN